MIVSSYLDNPLNIQRRKKILDMMVSMIVKSNIEFDTIVFTGMSGALISPSVADRLEKQVLLLRKDKDDCHSSCRMEGFYKCENYIIIDDQVSSGNTVLRIMEAMNNNNDWEPKTKFCKGVFLYNSQAPDSSINGIKIYSSFFSRHEDDMIDNTIIL